MAAADADDSVLTEKDAVLTSILNIAYADMTKRDDDTPFAVQRIVPMFDALAVLVRHHAHHLLPEKLQSKSEMKAFLTGFRSFMKTDARFVSLAEEATRAFDRDVWEEGAVMPAKTKESSQPQTSDPTVPEPYAAFRPATLDEVSVIGAVAPTGVASSSIVGKLLFDTIDFDKVVSMLASTISDVPHIAPLGMPLGAAIVMITKAFKAWVSGEENYGVSTRSSGWWVHALIQMLLWSTNAYLATVVAVGSDTPLGTSLVVTHQRSWLGALHCDANIMKRSYPSAFEIMEAINKLGAKSSTTQLQYPWTGWGARYPRFQGLYGPDGQFRGIDWVFASTPGSVYTEEEIYLALSGISIDDKTKELTLKFIQEVQRKVNGGPGPMYELCWSAQYILVVLSVLAFFARDRDWVKAEFKKSETILEKLNDIQEKGVVDDDIKRNTLKVMRAVFKTLFAEMQKSVADRKIGTIKARKMVIGSKLALDIYTRNAKGRYEEMGDETKIAVRAKVVAIMEKVKALGVVLTVPGGGEGGDAPAPAPTPAPAPAPAGPPGQGPAVDVNDADVVDLLDLWNYTNRHDDDDDNGDGVGPAPAAGRPVVSPARRRPTGARAPVVDAAYRARLRALRL